ncbi:MAG: recombinase family protein [Paracoccus denitrificans]|uniref:Recombinase family protein n=1 Tax=Paracoccus denitrificans TaxID=266 RepID=A0A533I5P1_PARDE|nr:MAG: recombinase family protein [Paracoccus denitrificans]
MLIGYARTSTTDQTAGLEAQKRDLDAIGCERIFAEQVSSVDKDKREALAEALKYARDGDTLIVTKLDRLARSVSHLVQLTGQLEAKGVHLRILDMGIDTSTPNGRLMLNLLGSIAQFEREIMLERQREGIAKAKADGKYRGRKPTNAGIVAEVLAEIAAGKPKAQIARERGLGRTTVHEIAKGAA